MSQLAVWENFAEHGIAIQFAPEEAQALEDSALEAALRASMQDAQPARYIGFLTKLRTCWSLRKKRENPLPKKSREKPRTHVHKVQHQEIAMVCQNQASFLQIQYHWMCRAPTCTDYMDSLTLLAMLLNTIDNMIEQSCSSS